MGEEDEKQMHAALGKRLSGCDASAAFPQNGIGFMPMMQMMTGGGGFNMMGSYGMMGGWFGATAIGNYLSGLFGGFYNSFPHHQFFGLLVILLFISAIMVRIFLKKLKHATR